MHSLSMTIVFRLCQKIKLYATLLPVSLCSGRLLITSGLMIILFKNCNKSNIAHLICPYAN